MLYSFELVIFGVLILGAMCICGVVMWWRRRNENMYEYDDGHSDIDDTTKR